MKAMVCSFARLPRARVLTSTFPSRDWLRGQRGAWRRDLMRSMVVAMTTGWICSMPVVHAQTVPADWPGSRPVTIIVPSAAGGAADFSGRLFARYLGAAVPGMTALVENKPGAGGIVGTEAAKHSAADGHTFLLSTNSTHAANLGLYRQLRYDPRKDFAPVGVFGTFGAVLMVPKSSPDQSVTALVDRARKTSGGLNFGYYSSSSQVPAELLRARAEAPMVGASYRDITQIMTDLAGGRLDFAFIDALSAAPALQNDRLRPLAVSSPQRMPRLPAVPTVAETFPGFEMQGWLGLTAPAGAPKAVVARVSELVVKAAADPAFREALEARGLVVSPMAATEMGAFIDADIARWASWISTAKIEPQ